MLNENVDIELRDLRVTDIPDGTCRTGFINGKPLAIFNVGGEIFVTQANCTHRGGPLCDGGLFGHVVTCPWHGSEFDVRDGHVVTDPAERPLKTYPVRVINGLIVIQDV